MLAGRLLRIPPESPGCPERLDAAVAGQGPRPDPGVRNGRPAMNT